MTAERISNRTVEEIGIKPLRVMAVAAPHWSHRASEASKTLNSQVPFSLQNALRLAAGQARTHHGAWSESNWSNQDGLNNSIVMYDYLSDALPDLEQKFRQVSPNLLLIGAMTLSLPGAIEIARMAKGMFGDDITVVLGGKHASETIYREDSQVRHSPSSPLRLMSDGKIPHNFDIVLSGDGENVITKLGELVTRYQTAKEVTSHLDELKDCAGNWIAGSYVQGETHTILSRGFPIDYASLPVPAEVFGFQGSFKVFDADRTAHVYSDISRGCIYNCFFCSERQRVNGVPKLMSAADYLARQLTAVAQSGQLHGDRVSAFVEDSILLMGNVEQLTQLRTLLHDQPVVPFGGQITVDLFLRDDVRRALLNLKEVGLTYLFTGLETGSESVAQSMSKNVGKKDSYSWMERNEIAVKLATEAGLKYGVSVLFGIGESHEERLSLLETIHVWQQKYEGNPCVASLNWATQHPLLDVGMYDYTDWGTPADSARLPYFQSLFGEASERYAINQDVPTVEQLEEIRAYFSRL